MVARDSSSSLPFILVALLSFGALTPHLVSRPAPATSAPDTAARSSYTAPASPSGAVGNTAVTDLLGEYFQVDTTPDGLKRRVAEAVRALKDPHDRVNAASVIRAFVCDKSNRGAESDLGRARQISAALVGSAASAAMLNCEPATVSQPATDADVAWLITYVQRCLDPWRDCAKFDGGPLTRAAIREQAHDVQVEFLIATVPDPVDSFQSWQFDPAVDGLRRGIEANGYTFQRFQFPDIALEQKPQTSLIAQQELHRRWPGVVLFSRPTSTLGREDLLVLFLVPETPTAGIHHEAFHRAIEFIGDWIAEGRGASKAGLAAIIGPTFSGSTLSLTRALQAAEPSLKRLPCGTLRVISGNATNYGNKAIVDGSLTRSGLCLSPQFKATVHPNQAMSGALRTFQKGIGVTGRAATITENTVFGLDPGRQQALAKNDDQSGDIQITVPLNIAQLRTGGVAAQRASTLDPVLPSVRPLPLQDLVNATDQLVVRTPETTAAYTELVLRNLIATIRRENIRTVQVTMTDVRDRLLLTKELRQRAPDVMIFTLDADLLYSHPDQYPWTADVVVVSSYPLYSVAQLRTTPSDLQHRLRQPQQFQNFSSQGIYNATVAALNYSVEGWIINRKRARLVDYAPEQGEVCPPIWISVVGRESLWPVATESECSDETQKYMVTAVDAGRLQSDGTVESEPSRGTTRLLVAIVLGLCIAAFIGRRHLWHPYAPEAFALAILSLLGGAVWFGQQLSAVLLAALALTVVPVAAVLPGRYSETRFGWVPLVAAVAVGAPLIVYVVLATRQPFVTATRLLEVESGVSPLAPILMMAAVPLLLCAVVLRHRYLRGGAGHKPPVTGDLWRWSTIDLLDHFALGRLQDLSPTLTAIYKDLFYLPSALWVVVGASLLVVAFIVFDLHWPFFPVWSVNGRSFGFAVFAVVLTLQFLLTVSLLQFLLQWRACAELLRRLARHPLGPAYKYVPKKMIPEGVLPKRLRLDDLKALLDRMPATETDSAAKGVVTLNKELQVHHESTAHLRIKPRWFSSLAWTGPIRNAVLSIQTPPPRPWTSEQKDRCGFVAMACVMVVRELMARLTISLLLIGPCLGLLIGIQATAPFQNSHALLGIIWVDVLATIGIVMSAFVQMDQDETLSLVTDTDPGRIAWNLDLLSKVAVYVVLPLLILFASQFPGIGTSIADVFRSIPRVGP